MNVAEAKARLRGEMRERLARLSPGDWTTASERVCQRVRDLDAWRGARWVGAYAAMSREIDVGPLMEEALARGMRVAVPGWDEASGTYGFREVRDPGRDLIDGPHRARVPRGECEAVDPGRLDFVLVPGIAFDGRGGRLGRGKGFYDRLLACSGGVTCGVGADEQWVPQVPVESHDVRLDWVLLPGRTVRPG